MGFDELVQAARAVYNPRQMAHNAWAGSVAAALLADNGKVYTGVCIDVCAGMGFCAEHSAIAAMITDGNMDTEVMVAPGEVVAMRELLPFHCGGV